MKRLRTTALLLVILLGAASLTVWATSALDLKLPDYPVSATFHAPGSNGISYFDIELSGIGPGYDVVDGFYPGWCVDHHSPLVNPTGTILKSSYDPNLPLGLQEYMGMPIPWPKINYVMNHKQGSGYDVALAVWLLISGEVWWYPPTPAATAMMDEADAYGADFVPGPGQVVVVILYGNGIAPDNWQETIIEVLLPEFEPASLGDYVWMDTNVNGIQEAGEPGIPGVTVNLYDCADNPVATTTTDGAGYYLFDGLMPGGYYVEFVAPGGYVFSPQDQGTDDATDSDADPTTGKTICTTLDSGENDLTWDAGLYEPASIGDLVWEDLNHNGIQDAGEPGIPGVTVNLYDCAGNSLATTTTDANGYYLFDGLMPGGYYVEFVPPSGYVFSPQDQGTDDAMDSDADRTTGMTVCTDLEAGENDLTWDAGLFMLPEGPGTGTPGYWMNHPEAWPVDEITIGGVTYLKDEAIGYMKDPVQKDKTFTMFPALVAAKLNVLIGNDDSCIADTIAAADAWMATYPVGSDVKGNSQAWAEGEPLYEELDLYNNGWLPCAASRDLYD